MQLGPGQVLVRPAQGHVSAAEEVTTPVTQTEPRHLSSKLGSSVSFSSRFCQTIQHLQRVWRNWS